MTLDQISIYCLWHWKSFVNFGCDNYSGCIYSSTGNTEARLLNLSPFNQAQAGYKWEQKNSAESNEKPNKKITAILLICIKLLFIIRCLM